MKMLASLMVALPMLLSGCTLERLRAFTVADLAATYNVSAAVVGKMLAAAREGRGL